jgi:hypothetical protein
MKPQQNPRYPEDCRQAEADLKDNMPWLFAMRAEGVPWNNFYAYKLTELNDWCLANQPRVILELGSGWTTFVMSRYTADFGARLITVEENSEWRDQGVMPRIPEWARVEWFMSPTVVEGELIRYQYLPQSLPEIDLLYVDGPASDGKGKAVAGADAVRLIESGVQVKSILVDIRTSTVDYMRSRLQGYGFEPGGTYPWAKPEYLRPRRHHSWFWRK